MTDTIYVAYIDAEEGKLGTTINTFNFERDETNANHQRLWDNMLANDNLLWPVTIPTYPNRVNFFSTDKIILDAFIAGLNADKNWLLSVALNPPQEEVKTSD